MKVGSGMTTRVPAPTVTSSRASMSSLEPLPASTPSALHPANRARACEQVLGVEVGIARPRAGASASSSTSRFTASGSSKGFSFWLILTRAGRAARV